MGKCVVWHSLCRTGHRIYATNALGTIETIDHPIRQPDLGGLLSSQTIGVKNAANH